MSEVRSAFQSYAGRQPTIYEFMQAVNWGDDVHNYVDDRSAWRTALYTAASNAAGRQIPSIGWYVTQPSDYEHLFSVTQILSGASYKWHIPDWGDGPTLRLGYSPPMFNRTVTYAGFVRVSVNGVRNMALVETKLVLPGTCAPNNGPYVNCQ